jgi:diguanylate cyclase (GGDEF)-like protein
MQAILHHWQGFSPRRWSIATRLAAMVAVIAGAAGAAIAAGVGGIYAAESHRHAAEREADLAGWAAMRLAPAMQRGDNLALDADLALAAAERGRARIEVYGADGSLRAAAGPPVARQGAEAFVRGPQGALGVVRVRTASAAEATLKFFAAAFALIIAIVMLAAPLAVGMVRRMLSPLNEAIQYAARLSPQSLGRRLDVRGEGELAALGEAINQMVSRLEAALRRARNLALIDPVTELPNQEQFEKQTARAIARLDRCGGAGAVIVIAFDRISGVAASMGAEAGQELLALVGQRLSGAVRAGDRAARAEDAVEHPALAARLGQTEFAVLAPRFEEMSDLGRFVQVMGNAVAQPIELQGQKLTLGRVMGVAVIPKDAADPATALRNARLALIAARTEHKAARVFTRGLDRAAAERIALEREIRDAIERGEFTVSFQPKVHLETGRIIGCEALARWVRPDGLKISPAIFIPAAEEAGLIGAVSEAIMAEACRTAAGWRTIGFEASLAVNVSPLQFNDDRFASRVMRILSDTGLDPQSLELEITESVAIGNPERAQRLVAPLRACGVRLALDDFGTGHSSLAALSRLPFDTLKIDQRFIRALQADRHAPAVIEAILAMAAALGYQATAEGVETEAQARFLRQRQCLYAQGYLFGPALPAQEFIDLLRAQDGEPLIALKGFAA